MRDALDHETRQWFLDRTTKALELAKAYSSHSWEWGTTASALLEVHSPQFTVFGSGFPLRTYDLTAPGLEYARRFISLESGHGLLSDATDGADACSLGHAALALALSDDPDAESYKRACAVQITTLLREMPRFPNGAISHQRTGRPEYWSDSVAMAPPFLAAYGVTMGEETCIREAVRQCRLYHGALAADSSYGKGGWKHILTGPDDRCDSGCWSTGNAWAAWGMTRVLAGLRSWHRLLSISSGVDLPVDETSWLYGATLGLEDWIQAILDLAKQATMRTQNHLAPNYLDDPLSPGESSGTMLFAAAAFRLEMIRGDKQFLRRAQSRQSAEQSAANIQWASSINCNIFVRCFDEATGAIGPAVDPFGIQPGIEEGSRGYLQEGSAEGQAFAGLLYAAWRDWCETCDSQDQGE